jgi:hypothetical protein
VLWIDAGQGRYGLRSAPGYGAYDDKALEYGLAASLTIEVSAASLASATSQSAMATPPAPGVLPMIRFEPNGFVSETSPLQLTLRENETFAVWIGPSRSGLHYEIQTSPTTFLARQTRP